MSLVNSIGVVVFGDLHAHWALQGLRRLARAPCSLPYGFGNAASSGMQRVLSEHAPLRPAYVQGVDIEGASALDPDAMQAHVTSLLVSGGRRSVGWMSLSDMQMPDFFSDQLSWMVADRLGVCLRQSGMRLVLLSTARYNLDKTMGLREKAVMTSGSAAQSQLLSRLTQLDPFHHATACYLGRCDRATHDAFLDKRIVLDAWARREREEREDRRM